MKCTEFHKHLATVSSRGTVHDGINWPSETKVRITQIQFVLVLTSC